MPKIELPPTKSSLRKIKEELAFAYEGHELLNQKREILAIEIVRKIDEIRRIESRFQDMLNSLYAAYRSAAVDMGGQAVTLKSCSEKKTYTVQLQFDKLMGLKLPRMVLEFAPFGPSDGLAETMATYDTARERSREALATLVEYATVTKEVITLSRELKKVQRRVNALEKIYIPPHEEAQKYIADRIEETEREEAFVKKLIRQRTAGRKDISL
ncbi:MAG: V-type ATP synthase subunit D [Syntrophaceae bacterium]|nr:V-type ATP synthase subunit D [Syntrophaceae bacterium]